MRRAKVKFDGHLAGILVEEETGREYRFEYHSSYGGPPISLTMPVQKESYVFKGFPPFFDGLLPEGFMLDALLRAHKLDRSDLFGQLLIVGLDTVGAVTIEEIR